MLYTLHSTDIVSIIINLWTCPTKAVRIHYRHVDQSIGIVKIMNQPAFWKAISTKTALFDGLETPHWIMVKQENPIRCSSVFINKTIIYDWWTAGHDGLTAVNHWKTMFSWSLQRLTTSHRCLQCCPMTSPHGKLEPQCIIYDKNINHHVSNIYIYIIYIATVFHVSSFKTYY